MIRLWRKIRMRAFTLIELMVVVAIIGLLAAILTPAVSKAMLTGKLAKTLGNGLGIYKVLFALASDNVSGLQEKSSSDLPKSADWGGKGSSRYFATLVTNESLALDYNMFTGPDVKVARSEAELVDQTVLYNAWCISLDVKLETTPPSVPVLFTQNIELSPQNIKTESFVGLNENAPPFGKKSSVVILVGGSAFKMDENTAISSNFNSSTKGTNVFEYPMASGQYTK